MNRYNNKIQPIFNGFNQLQPGGICDFNMKCDNGFLISRINSSIMIKFHQHPLYSCFSPLRANSSQFWTCNYCGSKYNYTVPSFYCTACDYDLCQKCLIQCQLYEIIMYDYSKNEFLNFTMTQNDGNYNLSVHNHRLALIKIEIYDPNNKYYIHCKACKGNIKNTDQFYYCSLCNFYLCEKCFIPDQNNNNNNQNFNNLPFNGFPNCNNNVNNQNYNNNAINNNNYNNTPINNNNNQRNNNNYNNNNNQRNNNNYNNQMNNNNFNNYNNNNQMNNNNYNNNQMNNNNFNNNNQMNNNNNYNNQNNNNQNYGNQNNGSGINPGSFNNFNQNFQNNPNNNNNSSNISSNSNQNIPQANNNSQVGNSLNQNQSNNASNFSNLDPYLTGQQMNNQ